MKSRILATLVAVAGICFAANWQSWNGVTVGQTSGNIGTLNSATIGTSTGNYNSWNGLASPASMPEFSLGQPVITNFTCTGAGTNPTCPVTATVAAGHTLVYISAITTVGSSAPVITSPPTGDSFQTCSAQPIASGAGQYGAVGCGYVLSAVGGTSTVYTFTWNGGSPAFWAQDVWLYDLTWSGSSITFDTNSFTMTNTGCTICNAPNLASFTGPDAVFQIASNIFAHYNAISGGYTLSAENSNGVYGAAAYLLNVASYSAPQWTTSTGGASAFIAIGFKGN